MPFRAVAIACLLVAASPGAGLAQEARAILATHCGRCHDRKQTENGGFDYLLDRDALVARKKIVPGRPSDSPLLQKVLKGEMPPGKAHRPTPAELAILEKWIAAGAPAWHTPTTGLALTEVYRLVETDLAGLHENNRRHARYFTLAHLPAVGWSAEEIEDCRHALTKLVNSLSWQARLTAPRALDADRLVFRIDLRHYLWNERLWDRLAAQDPYNPNAISQPARTLRADWFIATASIASNYYEFLQVPAADRALERLLQVDVTASIDAGKPRRAGFSDSGVSRHNRLIERHDAAHGAYWRSYDFSASTDRQNLLDHPLGPPPARNAFVHAGGEMIFHLPNGLLGYLITDAAGKRIERAPVEIVSDPGRAEKIVEAGISCFNCHAQGFIPKADQVRPHVLQNAQAFAKEDVAAVQALYRPDEELKKLLERDNKRYRAALANLGVPISGIDPINRVRNRHEGLVDARTAAAELGLAPAELAQRLRQSENLQRTLGSLLTDGGTVQRSTFLNALRELIITPVTLPTTMPPVFSGHTDRVLCVAFSADGRWAASGGADRTIRVWDVATGKELQVLEARTPVLAVAFSRDGRRLLGGGEDRLLRLWDLETGQVIQTLRGHTDAIRAVAFSPGGSRAVSAGADRTIRVWSLNSGQVITATPVLPGPIRTVAFAPDGQSILAPAGDRTVRLWDARTGKEIRRFTGHTDEVYAAAFAADGRRIVSGGNDKTVRVWDIDGAETRVLKGHANAVIAVAFSPDGQRILSVSSQYQQSDRSLRVWDAATGKELRAEGNVEVRGAALAADGKAALTIGHQPPIRLWRFE